MPKPHPIQINIPNPCHQSWDEMTPDGQGRHCSHCRRTVIDFTTFSDAALYDFFSKNTGKVCGRFYASQIGRPIHIPPQPNSRLYRMTIALGLTLVFTQAADTYAQGRVPKVTQNAHPGSVPAKDSVVTASTGSVSGSIGDERKPITNAWIGLFRDSVYERSVYSVSGHYSIGNLRPGKYRMVVQLDGYKQKEISGVNIQNGNNTTINVVMEYDPATERVPQIGVTGEVSDEWLEQQRKNKSKIKKSRAGREKKTD